MEEKHCKTCNKILQPMEVCNNYTCNDCELKNIKKKLNIGTILLIFGIVTFVLFIEMVLITIFKSLFGGFSVTFLVIGIILSILFFAGGVVMITYGSILMHYSKIITKKYKQSR